MCRILIDVSRLLDRFMKGRLPTGVDRVSLAYVRHFADQAHAVVHYAGRTVVLTPTVSREIFYQLLHPSVDFNRTVRWLVGREFLNLWSERRLEGKLLFNTGHSGLEKASYRKQLQRQGIKPLFMVHDLIPITHPEYCRSGELDKHVMRINNVLTFASGIIANSQATLDILRHYAGRIGRPMPPAATALLAAPVLPNPSDVRPISSPYFVVLSTIEPRKNHWLLLQIWRRLVDKMGSAAPKLVVIGQRGWECENVVDLLERCRELHGVVIELSTCSDIDLVTYLCHSQALLFPSFAEGYGMPLVEALSAQVPVIASDLPVFREIAGDIPDYLDPLDGSGWMSRIEEYTKSDSLERMAQLDRVTQFVAPSWSAHFQIVEELLEYVE